MKDQLPAEIVPRNRLLTAAEFRRLADVPPEIEWFANITNPHTRRAYENAVRDFMQFARIGRPAEFRAVTRAHAIAWRDELARRGVGGSTIRHRLASLASLFEYLCERNAVTHNPVKGVRRPRMGSADGNTPSIGDHQARKLLASPGDETLKAKRDRAIISTLLYYALRREELCKLKVRDFKHERRGVAHLKISGKGDKARYVPLHPATSGLIHDYLDAAGHGRCRRVIRNNITGKLDQAITSDGVYKLVRCYSAAFGFEIGAHALRATASTNALDHNADIAKVQEWLGHANISTTRMYDRRRPGLRTARRLTWRIGESPTTRCRSLNLRSSEYANRSIIATMIVATALMGGCAQQNEQQRQASIDGQGRRGDQVAKHHRHLSTLGVRSHWRSRLSRRRASERRDRIEQPPTVADRCYSDAGQILGR